MSSITTNNNNMTPQDVLSLNLNDSALDLLNAAIASHQVKLEEENKTKNDIDKATEAAVARQKREHDDDELPATAPKRAGRKPLDKSQTDDVSSDPKQKRKAQNRAAQRAFRDRKEKHVAELQARIDELEAMSATKDEKLVDENKSLKEMLEKLRQENNALKGATNFSFDFSPSLNNYNASNSHHGLSSDTKYTNSNSNAASSMSSGNSYSGEEVSSSTDQHSPLSNSHTHEDDSASADTPITNNALFSTEPLQFGFTNSNNNGLDFLAVADTSFNDFGNGLTTSENFPVTGDLFHGKDDLFTNYRAPLANTEDDFLFANEDFTNLVGGNNDLFGFNDQQFNFNEHFGLPEIPTSNDTSTKQNCTQEKKQMLVDKIKKGQEEGKHVYEIHQEIQNNCPGFDLDLLCDEMKMKATCTMGRYPITDRDVDAFVKCLDHV